ncbi:hypothetical protein BD779DRAFT_1551613 [Infundibulicybe gibba]|nr:hypothetical protein BD779DRAFT_1551613 [Infundibulicybe gibba]
MKFPNKQQCLILAGFTVSVRTNIAAGVCLIFIVESDSWGLPPSADSTGVANSPKRLVGEVRYNIPFTILPTYNIYITINILGCAKKSNLGPKSHLHMDLLTHETIRDFTDNGGELNGARFCSGGI